MKGKQISPLAIAEKFGRIVKVWQELEKRPRNFGTEEELYSSEIHLIEVVGESKNLSVTDIAGQLGVTKGAISQTLKKIEKKGLAVKKPDPDNSSRMFVELTTKGKVAFFAHQHWHEKMDGGFKNYFSGLPDEKLRFLDEVLSVVEDFMKKL